MARPIAWAGLALVLAALSVSHIPAGGKLDPVKVKVSPGKASGDRQAVLVELKIEKGWHIYANPTGNREIAAAATVVKVKAGGKEVAAKVSFPPGTQHADKDVGMYKLYEDRVVIPVEFAKGNAPVEISVGYQACDANRCIPFKTVKVPVK